MNTNRLRLGELVAAVAALLLFIDMFFKWYGIKAPGEPGGFTAWGAFRFVDFLLLVVIVAALGLALLTMTQRSVALPVSASVVVTALGTLAALIVLYRIFNQPQDNDLVTVKFAAYLGLLLTIGIAAGGFLSMREEGTTFGQAAGQFQGRASPSQTPTSPAAPPPPGTGAQTSPDAPTSTPPPGSGGSRPGAPPPG